MYKDRRDAGRRLSKELSQYRIDEGIILALPRGGVPVGAEVAKALDLPLDIIVPRKIGAPGSPDMAIGAVGPGGIRFLDKKLIHRLGLPKSYIESETVKELHEMERRLTVYRANMPPPDVKGKVVILVDDGIATGSTMIAAARGVWSLKPGSITIAVPVGPKETIRRLRDEAEMIICPYTPEPFNAVGQFYEDFHEMSDREVLDILKEFR